MIVGGGGGGAAQPQQFQRFEPLGGFIEANGRIIRMHAFWQAGTDMNKGRVHQQRPTETSRICHRVPGRLWQLILRR